MPGFYDTPQWRALRKATLARFPMCSVRGCGHKARHVDHIFTLRAYPHRSLDPTNLQTLCPAHHSALTRAYDNGRLHGACDTDGRPLDPAHPWLQHSNTDAIKAANSTALRIPSALGAQLKAAYVRGDRR